MKQKPPVCNRQRRALKSRAPIAERCVIVTGMSPQSCCTYSQEEEEEEENTDTERERGKGRGGEGCGGWGGGEGGERGERGGSQGKWWPFSTFEAVSASFVPDTREERCGVAGWWRQALPADFIGRKDVMVVVSPATPRVSLGLVNQFPASAVQSTISNQPFPSKTLNPDRLTPNGRPKLQALVSLRHPSFNGGRCRKTMLGVCCRP